MNFINLVLFLSRHSTRCLQCLTLLSGTCCTQVMAQEGDWNANLFFENDLFTNTDLNYTNGMRFTIVSPDLDSFIDPQGETYPIFEHLNEFLLGLDFPLHPSKLEGDNPQLNVSASLGQLMFTPGDRYREDEDPDDRPYAGWLYLGVGLQSRTDNVMYSMELDVGMIGPASLAEETQNLVHDIRGIDRFEGWDNQLKNEPGFMLSTVRKDRMAKTRLFGDSRWSMDFITHAGFTLGNVMTHINGGAELRIGYQLPSDFGTSTLRPGGDSSTPGMSSQRDETWRFQAFASSDARLVAHNIFLDGNTFRNSHSVERRSVVGELALGTALSYKRWKLSYAYVARTREFEGQRQAQRYGSVLLSYSHTITF